MQIIRNIYDCFFQKKIVTFKKFEHNIKGKLSEKTALMMLNGFQISTVSKTPLSILLLISIKRSKFQ